ncbi:hypothetical protein [Agarilytica rhodophyticola]|uniref:hypothetical protein n=1 Tax=Agarilytica rhodophyticola TaxID=1737490 RepID=UPI0013154640|nr:hypothetical protein [Agarilytica rhodophyticola]
MINNLQKESVLIWSVDENNIDSSRVRRDITRFESWLNGNEAGSITFLSWGLLIVLDEMLEDDLEMKLLLETPWGNNLLNEAKRQACNQIQIITGYRLPVDTCLKLVR